MVKVSSRAIPATASSRAKPSAAAGDRRPAVTGRLCVRAMIESMRRSTTWLTAAAAPAHRPMPRLPNTSTGQATPARVARNMPTKDVISISSTTRGLVSSR
ncbi:hypothetical protein D3C78_1589980 [compost metagenome]